MALKVKAKEQYQNIGKYAGKYRYVMMPELYTALTQDKVIKEAALRSGVSRGVMQACWDAAGEVIKAWATEGHSVALPGLGTMRFGLRAKSVEKVDEVKAGLISSRRIVFTPTSELKEELAKTAVQITCYDRTGKEVKRVTSADDGTVATPRVVTTLVVATLVVAARAATTTTTRMVERTRTSEPCRAEGLRPRHPEESSMRLRRGSRFSDLKVRATKGR